MKNVEAWLTASDVFLSVFCLGAGWWLWSLYERHEMARRGLSAGVKAAAVSASAPQAPAAPTAHGWSPALPYGYNVPAGGNATFITEGS